MTRGGSLSVGARGAGGPRITYLLQDEITMAGELPPLCAPLSGVCAPLSSGRFLYTRKKKHRHDVCQFRNSPPEKFDRYIVSEFNHMTCT